MDAGGESAGFIFANALENLMKAGGEMTMKGYIVACSNMQTVYSGQVYFYCRIRQVARCCVRDKQQQCGFTGWH